MFGDFFREKVPGQFFRALCQNEKCRDQKTKERTQVGGLHIPAAQGMAVFVCFRCGTVSMFEQGPFALTAKVLGMVEVHR